MHKATNNSIDWICSEAYGAVKDTATHPQKDVLVKQIFSRVLNAGYQEAECETLAADTTQDMVRWCCRVTESQNNVQFLAHDIKELDGIQSVLIKNEKVPELWIITDRCTEEVFDKITDYILVHERQHKRSINYIYLSVDDLKQEPEYDIKI